MVLRMVGRMTVLHWKMGWRSWVFSRRMWSVVINTHLHFDHAGGNTYIDADHQVHVTFPKARYVTQRGEFDYALHTNERTAASYFERNFIPTRGLRSARVD